MNRRIRVIALPILAAFLTCTATIAQDHPDQGRHDNDTYRQHDEWKPGSRIRQEDWNRGDKLNYRANHLRRPPVGSEWRKIDGNYVLANQDGAVINVRPSSPKQ
jgi:Ni/Co efflux regulator RcnB